MATIRRPIELACTLRSIAEVLQREGGEAIVTDYLGRIAGYYGSSPITEADENVR